MQETCVQSLDQENPLVKERAIYILQYSCLEDPTDGGAWGGYSSCGHQESDVTEHTRIPKGSGLGVGEHACDRIEDLVI